MRTIWIIAKRELNSFFDSLIAYVLLTIFLMITGFFTWLLVSDVFLINQASLQTMFGVSFWSLLWFIPAITMRSIAEEKKTGTIELLLTRAVTDRQIIIGKFIASFILVALAFAFTLPYYITVANLGDIDHGATLCGYLGVLLMSAGYIGIGIMFSSVTDNQIVAFLLSLVSIFMLHMVFSFLAGNTTGTLSAVFRFFSANDHFQSMARGVIDMRDVVYFLSLAGLGLFLSEVQLSKRNIQ